MFWAWLSLLFLVFEFLIIFGGQTLFNDKYNLMVIGIHIVGIAVSGGFLQTTGKYSYMTGIFIITSACPLLIELFSLLYSKMNYRKSFVV